MDFRIDHKRNVSVFELTEQTHDILKQEKDARGVEETHNWIIKTLLEMSGKEHPESQSVSGINIAVSVSDSFLKLTPSQMQVNHAI